MQEVETLGKEKHQEMTVSQKDTNEAKKKVDECREKLDEIRVCLVI